MKRFQFTFIARRAGAIGILGHFTAIREGASQEEAFGKLYDEFEHIRSGWKGVELVEEGVGGFREI